jgi:hypothetical protein
MFVQETDVALTVTKSHEVLAEQTHTYRWTVALSDFLR